MGQQQLILLVLGVVIVALAVVVGIQHFGSQKRKADADLCQTEATRLAMSARRWRATPTTLGGGLGKTSFDGFSLNTAGYTDTVLSTADDEVASAGGHFYSVWNRTTPQAHVAVINIEYTIQAAVFLYGQSENCLVMRTGALQADGSWNYQPAEVPPRPAGCSW